MPDTIASLRAVNRILRRKISDQGLLIHNLRETNRRVRGTKVALVAGRFTASVNPNEEAERAKQFTLPAAGVYKRTLDVLKGFAQITGPDGKPARDLLKDLGR